MAPVATPARSTALVHLPQQPPLQAETQPELPKPEDADFDALLEGTVGNYVKQHFRGKTDYCIPIIVDQQVSKNVMEEVTDGPLMNNRSFHLILSTFMCLPT